MALGYVETFLELGSPKNVGEVDRKGAPAEYCRSHQPSWYELSPTLETHNRSVGAIPSSPSDTFQLEVG